MILDANSIECRKSNKDTNDFTNECSKLPANIQNKIMAFNELKNSQKKEIKITNLSMESFSNNF